MRLPWPFHRSAPDGGATAPAAQGTVQRAMAPVRRDWASTGDLRPSFVGDPGIRVQRFPDDIAGSQLPPPILAPLGHERSADGPTGLVTGLAHPTLASVIHGSVGRAELPLRQRRASSGTLQRAVADEASPDDQAGQAPVVAPPSASRTPAGGDGVPATDAMTAPGDRLPVIEARRAAIVPVTSWPARPVSLTVARTPDLTLAPSRGSTPPDATIGTRQAQGSLPASAPSGTLPVPVTGTATRTILRTSSGSRVRLGPPIQRSALEQAAPALELAHPGRDASATAPPAASIQRHPASDEGTHDHAGRAPDPAAPLVGGLATTLGGDPLASPAAREELTPGIPGGLVLARVVATPTDQVQPEPIQRSSDAPVDFPGSVAPLVGASSMAPSAGLRPTVPSPMGPSDPATGPGTTSTRARPTATRGANRPTAQRVVAGDERPSRRLAMAAGTAAASLGPSPAPTALQRVARVSATGAGGAGARPVAITSPSPAIADLVLARTPGPTVASAHDQPATGGGTSGSTAPRLAVLRDATDVATPEQDAVEPEDAGSASPASNDATTVSSTTTRAAASGGAGPIAERDLEEMVRRLYPRLRRSLSSELLVARERAGTLADLR